jgi:hypothetical protein
VLFTLVEGCMMMVCKWGTLRRSIADAAITNVVSTVIGAILLFSLSVRPLLTSFIPVLLITWGWSVLVKGGVLLLMRRHPPRQTWRTALYANIVSYAAWAVFFVSFNGQPQLF